MSAHMTAFFSCRRIELFLISHERWVTGPCIYICREHKNIMSFHFPPFSFSVICLSSLHLSIYNLSNHIPVYLSLYKSSVMCLSMYIYIYLSLYHLSILIYHIYHIYNIYIIYLSISHIYK